MPCPWGRRCSCRRPGGAGQGGGGGGGGGATAPEAGRGPRKGRRAFLASPAWGVAAGAWGGSRRGMLPPSQRPRPSPAQLAWQRDELAMFLHFGVNTFTDREWGDGREDPAIFNPAGLDARQWARAARAAGFRAMILTAKHHDACCLWP